MGVKGDETPKQWQPNNQEDPHSIPTAISLNLSISCELKLFEMQFLFNSNKSTRKCNVTY